MVTRVATFSMNERMLAASLKTQARMADMQLQEASGRVSETYGGLGAQAESLVKLEVSQSRSEAYAAAASEANSRVEVMYDSLSTMTDILTQLRSDIAAAISVNGGEANAADLSQAAQNYLDQFTSLLNTQYEGRYLFAGAATTTAPIDSSAVTTADINTPLSGYYNGDDTVVFVKVSEFQTISYGITAGDPAFESGLRVLGYLAGASSGALDADTLSAVSEQLLDSLDAITSVQSQLSLNSAALERAISSQTSSQDSLAASASAIRDTDVTAVAAKLTAYETQLQASYSALAKLQSISLLKYM